MRTEIGRRVAALETRAAIGHDAVEVIIRAFVSPGPNGPVNSEPRAFVSLTHGWRVDRLEGETAEAFLKRAIDSSPRTSGAVTRLVEEVA